MNHHHRLLLSLSAGLGTLTLAFAASAADVAEEPALVDPSHWSLGLGVGTRTKPYRGVDRETRALPIISFENRWVKVLGQGAELKLGKADQFSFGLKAQYSLEGYESDDAPILNGMEERKGGFWIGPTATWHHPAFELSTDLLGDASSHSKGTQFRVALGKEFRFGAFGLAPRVSATWLDNKYVDYYYGVRAGEARADRPFYDGRSTTNLELALRSSYALTPQHIFFLDVGTTALGKEIKDSPLVDRSTETGVRFGYLHRF